MAPYEINTKAAVKFVANPFLVSELGWLKHLGAVAGSRINDYAPLIYMKHDAESCKPNSKPIANFCQQEVASRDATDSNPYALVYPNFPSNANAFPILSAQSYPNQPQFASVKKLETDSGIASVQQMASALANSSAGAGSASILGSNGPMLGIGGAIGNGFGTFSPAGCVPSTSTAAFGGAIGLNSAYHYLPASADLDFAAAAHVIGQRSKLQQQDGPLGNNSLLNSQVPYSTTYGATNAAYFYPQNYYYPFRNGSTFPTYFSTPYSTGYPYSANIDYYNNAVASCYGQNGQSLISNMMGISSTSSSMNTSRSYQSHYSTDGNVATEPDCGATSLCASNLEATAEVIPSSSRSTSHGYLSKKISKSKCEKASKRSKRKKQNSKAANAVGGREATANELENETQVFVWELEDLCACASYSNWSTHGNKDLFSSQICQILQSVFQIDNWEEYDYSNLDDATLDESMQELVDDNSNILQEIPTTSGTSANNNNCIVDPLAIGSDSAESPITRLDGLRRMAAKYGHIKKAYANAATNISLLESTDTFPSGQRFQNLAEHYLGSHPISERFKRCLRLITEKNLKLDFRCTNVVITQDPLIQALAQLLLFKLAIYIPPENVYSSAKVGKKAVLEKICNRFNKKRIIISSLNPETAQLVYSVSPDDRIPFWSIKNVGDIDKFHVALECILLVDVDTGTSQKKQHEQQLSEATTNLIENQLATPIISNSSN